MPDGSPVPPTVRRVTRKLPMYDRTRSPIKRRMAFTGAPSRSHPRARSRVAQRNARFGDGARHGIGEGGCALAVLGHARDAPACTVRVQRDEVDARALAR